MNPLLRILHMSLIIFVILALIAFVYLQSKNPSIESYEISFQTNCFIGVGMGFLLNLRFGTRGLYYALSLLSAITGAIVALQKISLHICPDTPPFGDPIFGISVSSWSLLLFVFFIFAISCLLIISQHRRLR